jgi:hypothetical protein
MIDFKTFQSFIAMLDKALIENDSDISEMDVDDD